MRWKLEESTVSVKDFLFGVACKDFEGLGAVDYGEIWDFGIAEDEGSSIVDSSEFVGWILTLADVDLRLRLGQP